MSFEAIIYAVCKLLNPQKEQITQNTQSPTVAYAKGMISKLAIEKSNLSKDCIAQYMNRDSSPHFSQKLENSDRSVTPSFCKLLLSLR